MIKRIYLETNVLVATRWPGNISVELALVAFLGRHHGIEICIPNSVLIEHEASTIRHVTEHLQIAAREIKNAAGRLNRLVDLPMPPSFDAVAFRAAYAAAVSRVNRQYGFTIMPTTPVLIEDFVQMAASHTPPFKDEDRGFRDAVHFRSIVSHMQSIPPAGEAVVVTADGDFSTGLPKAAGIDLVIHRALKSVIRVLSDSLGVNVLTKVDWIPELKSSAAKWVPTLSDAFLHLGTLFDWKRFRQLSEPKLDDIVGAPLGYSPEVATPNLYRVTFDMSVRFDVLASNWFYIDPPDRPGGPRTDFHNARLEENWLIAVDALVTQGDSGQVQSIEYESARLLGRRWPRTNPLTQQTEWRTEDLPEAVELIVPGRTGPSTTGLTSLAG